MLLEKILDDKIIVAVRNSSLEQAKHTLDALIEGGIRFVEFAFNQQADDLSPILEAIEHAAQIGSIHVGAGTVLTTDQVDLAYNAGAEYIISPTAQQEVIAQTKNRELLSIPGALTPTEIINAQHWGADLIKLFPAAQMGDGYIRALRTPLNHVPIMVMGGIHLDNMKKYFRAGASAFGIGSDIVNKDYLEQGNYAKITQLAQSYTKCTRELQP